MVFILDGKVLIFGFVGVVMVNKRGFIGLIVIVLLLVFGFVLFYYLNKDKILASEVVGECRNDSDCKIIQTSCCPCSSGGQDRCVNLSLASEYELNLSSCSKTRICAQVYNCKVESCGCVNGKCIG